MDAAPVEKAWNALAKSMRAGNRLAPQDVAEFRKWVDVYRDQGADAMAGVSITDGRGQVGSIHDVA